MIEIAELTAAIFTAAGLVWAILAFWLDRSEKKEIRIQKLQQDSILLSISKMSEVMADFKTTQNEQGRAIQSIQVSVAELNLMVSFLRDQFSRGAVIQTGDGYKLDPNKVNKQR